MPSALILKQPYLPGDPGWLKLHLEAGDVIEEMLRENGFEVEVTQTLDRLLGGESLKALDLIAPAWEAGTITDGQLRPLMQAVEGGTGLAGFHGIMADSFRDCLPYHRMVGGQFVFHGSGQETYRVYIDGAPSPITEGIEDFEVTSEKYSMHVDPGNCVLATTRFDEVVMPVTWTRMHGKGRVFYCSVGHDRKTMEIPEVYTMVTRGLLWAAAGR